MEATVTGFEVLTAMDCAGRIADGVWATETLFVRKRTQLTSYGTSQKKL